MSRDGPPICRTDRPRDVVEAVVERPVADRRRRDQASGGQVVGAALAHGRSLRARRASGLVNHGCQPTTAGKAGPSLCTDELEPDAVRGQLDALLAPARPRPVRTEVDREVGRGRGHLHDRPRPAPDRAVDGVRRVLLRHRQPVLGALPGEPAVAGAAGPRRHHEGAVVGEQRQVADRELHEAPAVVGVDRRGGGSGSELQHACEPRWRAIGGAAGHEGVGHRRRRGRGRHRARSRRARWA